MERIVIAGSSGHAKVVIDIVRSANRQAIVGLVDAFRPAGQETLGCRVIGREEDLPALVQEHRVSGIAVAIGDNFARSKVAARVAGLCPGLRFVTCIHPAATVARDVSVGEGTVIMAGAVINPGCTVGRFCILNTRSSLDHDSHMGDFASLAPAATTGGGCRIGSYSAIGIGAVLVHRMSIGEHCVIGAGSTVLADVEPFQVAYGTPAKPIRARSAGDEYL